MLTTETEYQDSIREIARGSLLPGQSMPTDDEGLFGRVDVEKMDAELHYLALTHHRGIERLQSGIREGNGQATIASLKLLAAFWPAAEAARQATAIGWSNPTIASLAASSRLGCQIRSHEPGHESMFPALAPDAARFKILLLLVILPTGLIVLLGTMVAAFCAPCCGPCTQRALAKTVMIAFSGPLFCAWAFVTNILPGLIAVYRQRDLEQQP
jgi:hypothetical protein